MRPTYIKLVGFDTEHTRFARKYGLYLYRERLVDDYSEEDIGVCFVSFRFHAVCIYLVGCLLT